MPRRLSLRAGRAHNCAPETDHQPALDDGPILKILHVYKDYDPPVRGGIEGHVARSCRYQSQWAEVEALACSRARRTRRIQRDGIAVTEVGEWGRLLQAPLSPSFPWHLRRMGTGVVVLHMPNPTAEVAWLLARPRGMLIVRYHSDVVRQARAMGFYGPIQQRLLRRAALILPTSQQYLDTSAALAPHRDRCRAVPLGIESARFREADAGRVAALRADYGEKFVLFAGRHRYYKGLSVLVEAASAMDAPVVIAGDGPERAGLLRQAEARGVAIRFPGELTHEDLVTHLHAATVVVLPSIARSEAFGIAIMEAHAAARPLVATRLGTGVELINEDGKTGYNVAPGDPGALAGAVNALLADPEACARMGGYAQARVAADFDAAQLAETEWRLYGEVAR